MLIENYFITSEWHVYLKIDINLKTCRAGQVLPEDI